LQLREEKAMERREQLETLRIMNLMSRADAREHRIRMAAEISQGIEERRQRRARRRIVKKFLKSAALQMTALEDVEKETELKALREHKRKDYVERAERKHDFRKMQIEQRIRQKEERIEAQRRERQLMLEQQKARMRREVMTRRKILEAPPPKTTVAAKVEKELVSLLRPDGTRKSVSPMRVRQQCVPALPSFRSAAWSA
jgi:hypothetical protein